MKVHRIASTVDYDGAALKSQWALRQFGILGDSLVTFRGCCDVARENMADLVDLAAGSRIASEDMVHFVVEHFDLDLDRTLLRQRVLAALVFEEISQALSPGDLVRRFSDLYYKNRKLTISIAALTPVSSKIHFGINVKAPSDVGVPTAGLQELGIDPAQVQVQVCERYVHDEERRKLDRAKARPIP